jgi:uncharacterized membrane-anchored protein
MRYWCFLLFSIAVFAALNFSIWRNEQLLSYGYTMLLELAPADPRSLMQGDYMRLNYKTAQDMGRGDVKRDSGYLIIAQDNADGLGKFVRYDDGSPLNEGEMRLRYHRTAWGSVQIQPDSYMFQEGHAALYDQARYGVFAYDVSGKALLIGLMDAEKKKIDASYQLPVVAEDQATPPDTAPAAAEGQPVP